MEGTKTNGSGGTRRRWIGIRHRTKKTKAGEARPTQVAIRTDDGTVRTLDLADERAELDFVYGKYPTQWRAVTPEDDLATVATHHRKYRKLADGDDVGAVRESHRMVEGKQVFVLDKVPASYDGLQSGDVVGMSLGGAGDNLAYALSVQAGKIGADVRRVPPYLLKERRGTGDRDNDATLLVEIVHDEPQLFYTVMRPDRDIVLVRECLRARMDAMRDRIACEQRIWGRLQGRIFCSEEGLFPEGSIEDLFASAKANDTTLRELEREERRRIRDLEGALDAVPVYRDVLAKVEGCGPLIAARLIAAIMYVRLFSTDAKLKAFCGVHVMGGNQYGYRLQCASCGTSAPLEADIAATGDGLAHVRCATCNGALTIAYVSPFPRHRDGSAANWNPDARQALYLLTEQFNRRPQSEWGQRLLQIKAKFHVTHPEVIVVDGKKRYTDGHILKMARWRAATKFAEWLYREWRRVERALVGREPQPTRPTRDQPQRTTATV